MTKDGSRLYEFGAFAIDAHRRTLCDEHGSPIRISAQAFDALIYLVEHAGSIVRRAELMDALWPDAIVEDNSLSRTIMQLRRVLGDGYIVTVKGRGYQFVAAVRSAEHEPSPSSRGNPRPGIFEHVPSCLTNGSMVPSCT